MFCNCALICYGTALVKMIILIKQCCQSKFWLAPEQIHRITDKSKQMLDLVKIPTLNKYTLNSQTSKKLLKRAWLLNGSIHFIPTFLTKISISAISFLKIFLKMTPSNQVRFTKMSKSKFKSLKRTTLKNTNFEQQLSSA